MHTGEKTNKCNECKKREQAVNIMGGAVYTEDLVAKQERKEKIYEMMRQVCHSRYDINIVIIIIGIIIVIFNVIIIKIYDARVTGRLSAENFM